MRTLGFALIGGGVVVIALAFNMSVELPSEPGVANTDLMNQRLMEAVVGVGLFVAGIILTAVVWLAKRVGPPPPDA